MKESKRVREREREKEKEREKGDKSYIDERKSRKVERERERERRWTRFTGKEKEWRKPRIGTTRGNAGGILSRGSAEETRRG